jgi:eukaryotic-like serine/threonine-protein kinase
MALEAGSSIGERYSLVRALDRGGMGTVWEACDVSGSAVAIKFLSYSVANPAALRRFRREAKALEHLNHPNVVRIIDHGLEDNVPFIAMELLKGQSLRSLLQSGPLPPRQALEVLRDTALGLGAAHALGIVHRDVKPSNLFLCSGEARSLTKVIDFGIATGDRFETDSQGSTTGMIGSPAYMSPEQARGERLDHSADVWSLAVVAFQMLTGREPFSGANIPETLQRICSGRVPRASELASGLPAGIDKIFQRAFAAKPDQRIASLTELMTALQTAYRAAPNVAATRLAPNKTGRSDTTLSFGVVDARAARLPGGGRAWLVAIALITAAVAALWHASNGDDQEVATRPADGPERAPESPQVAAVPASVANDAATAELVVPRAPESKPPAASPDRKKTAPFKPPRPDASAKAGKPEPPSVAASPVRALPSAVAPDLDPVFGLRVSKPDAREEALSAGTDTHGGDVRGEPSAR